MDDSDDEEQEEEMEQEEMEEEEVEEDEEEDTDAQYEGSEGLSDLDSFGEAREKQRYSNRKRSAD